MSQKKVDAYKARRANIEKIKRKEKRDNLIQNIIITLVAIFVIAWIGYSVYGKLYENKGKNEVAEQSTVVNFDSVNNYLAGLNGSPNKK